jgi:hypothetical protein
MESTERSEEMTKAELMAEIEKHETEIDMLRAQRDVLGLQIADHEKALVTLERELYATGWTKARPRKSKGEATVAKKRGAKAGAENA